jgi:hypothetical protein
MFTEAGTPMKLGLLDDSFTTQPPGGAEYFNVTVPVVDVPPTTELGEAATEIMLSPVTVNVVLAFELLSYAVIIVL